MAEGHEVITREAAPDQRTAEEIRAEIGRKRHAISATVKRLEYQFHRTVDWRTHVASHPLAAAGIAAGIGAAAVLMLWKPRRDPLERVADAVADTVEDIRAALGASIENVAGAVRGRARRTSRDDQPSVARATVVSAIVVAATDPLRQRLTEWMRSETRPVPKRTAGNV